jgi:hypothetical protein
MIILSNAIPSVLTTLYWNAFPLPERVRKEMNLIPTSAYNSKVNVFQVSITNFSSTECVCVWVLCACLHIHMRTCTHKCICAHASTDCTMHIVLYLNIFIIFSFGNFIPQYCESWNLWKQCEKAFYLCTSLHSANTKVVWKVKNVLPYKDIYW